MSVLGPVTVRHTEDALTSSRVSQPRQLGLLCYLALARPRGLHSRDTLVALLWPDADEVRGRRALRNALHGLRLKLGTHAIVSVGDSLVGIDPAAVACDVIDLERGVTAAAELGEPLQGLHVEGAHDFDAWMSRERERIHALLRSRTEGAVAARAPLKNVRRPHSPDAAAMYARGHFLFLRTAHGGPAEELLLSREYFERARALDPTFGPALAGLSNFYAVAARRGVLKPFEEHFGTAISLSREALLMDETLAIPHVHFAVKALYLDDDWDLAGREFATAVAKDPEYAEGHRFYGVWLGMVRRHTEALREVEEAARLEPDIPHMLSSLAAARLAAGDRVGAEEALRRTLSLDPRHAPARARILQLLEDDGRIDEALAERLRSPALAGAEALAVAYGKSGEVGYRRALHDALLSEAKAIEARVVEKEPNNVGDIFSPPIVRLVGLYARLGDWRRVREWQLQGIAERPALGRWFKSLPELDGAADVGHLQRSHS